MPTPLLYAIPLFGDTQTNTSQTAGQRIASLAAVSGSNGAPSVQSTGSNADSQILEGQIPGAFAEVIARELSELGAAADIGTVPLFFPESSGPIEGYYAIEEAEASPFDPRTSNVQQYRLSLTRSGTRKTHRRAVTMTRADISTENPFADGDPGRIGLPSTARRPQWFDPIGGTLEPAKPTDRVRGERVGYDRYDPEAASFYDPTVADPHVPRLVYDIAHDDEYIADIRVWDDRDTAKIDYAAGGAAVSTTTAVGSATVGPGIDLATQWGRVYNPGHEFAGAAVLESGSVRLVIDDRDGTLAAYRPHGPYDSFGRYALGSSPWAVADLDLTSIGLASITAQVTFRNAVTDAEYALDVALARGYQRPIWVEPPNESASIPSDLRRKLRPIASQRATQFTPDASLVERQTLRR